MNQVLPLLLSVALVSAKPPPLPPGISFFTGLTDGAVLQRAPKAANVYGTLGKGGTGATVAVSSADGAFAAYSVEASVAGAAWKAALKPMPDGGDVKITATCTGCADAKPAVLQHVAFGDVYYCSGQSNMWLPLSNTLTRNATVAALADGQLKNIRLMAGDSQIMSTSCGWGGGGAGLGTDHTSKCGWQTAAAAATDGLCTGMTIFLPNGTGVKTCSLERFSAACTCRCWCCSCCCPCPCCRRYCRWCCCCSCRRRCG